jgi:hypothetical protein
MHDYFVFTPVPYTVPLHICTLLRYIVIVTARTYVHDVMGTGLALPPAPPVTTLISMYPTARQREDCSHSNNPAGALRERIRGHATPRRARICSEWSGSSTHHHHHQLWIRTLIIDVHPSSMERFLLGGGGGSIRPARSTTKNTLATEADSVRFYAGRILRIRHTSFIHSASLIPRGQDV